MSRPRTTCEAGAWWILATALLTGCDCTAPPPRNQTASAPVRPTVPGFDFLRHETFSCGGQRHSVAVFKHEKTDLEFVLIPGGAFMMGSPDGENGRDSDEGPRHPVTVKSFLMCRTETTNAAYRKLRSDHDSGSYEGLDLNGDSQPVVNINWEDAASWCQESGLRLPTEAEWEYACRAGASNPHFWGDSTREGGRYANVADLTAKQRWPKWTTMDTNDGHTASAPVGSFQPNSFGLYDMIGNAWEWCEDTWHDGYNGAPSDGGAWSGGPSSRIYRGGSWFNLPERCRSAFRDWDFPGNSFACLGFRPACSIP